MEHLLTLNIGVLKGSVPGCPPCSHCFLLLAVFFGLNSNISLTPKCVSFSGFPGLFHIFWGNITDYQTNCLKLRFWVSLQICSSVEFPISVASASFSCWKPESHSDSFYSFTSFPNPDLFLNAISSTSKPLKFFFHFSLSLLPSLSLPRQMQYNLLVDSPHLVCPALIHLQIKAEVSF